MPAPLDNLVDDLLGSAEHFHLNAPSHLRTLLGQCAGLAQALALAMAQGDCLDHDHQAALVQTSNLLAEYTRFTCALYAALDEQT